METNSNNTLNFLLRKIDFKKMKIKASLTNDAQLGFLLSSLIS